MIKNVSWAIFATISCLTTATFAGVPMSSLVEDDVDIYFSLHSPAELRTQWEGHPFAAVVNDPQIQAFFEPLLEDFASSEEESFTEVMENEFGLTWDDFFELFPGQFVFSWYNLPELMLEQAERPEGVLMVEYAGEPERLAELMQVQFDRNAAAQQELNPEIEHTMLEETFMGETLYFDEVFDGVETYIEDGYALVDGIFILASPESRLRSAVEAIKATPENPLSENEAFLQARERGGRGDALLYVNLEAMLPPLNEALVQQAMANGAAMLGLSAQSLEAALSLQSMQGLFVDVDLIEDGLSSNSGLIYREKAGLLRLITYTGGALPEARYVPDGVISSTVTTFDFAAMLEELEAMVGDASQTLPMMIDLQLQNLRNRTGVDLRTAVLSNFGDEMVSLSILPTGATRGQLGVQPEQVVVVALHDADALSAALEVLKDLQPGLREFIKTKMFAGQTIHTIEGARDPDQPEVAANDVSYVITRTHFILNIGQMGLLQEVLTSMESGAEGFWQKPETEAMFESFTASGVVSRSYVDMEQLAEHFFQSVAQASQYGGDSTALDLEQVPKDLSLPFNAITEVSESTDGIFSRTRIVKREVAE